MRDTEARRAEEERLYRQKLAEEQAREMQRRKPKERNANLGSDKPRVRKIPISSSDEDQAQAAKIILRFIRNKRSTRQVRQILRKLHQLRSIEDKLGEIRSSYTPGPLTFTADSERRVLPTTAENKEFLKNEENVMKVFDELDGIQSAGADIVRQRRKEIVKYAQSILETFDINRDEQWMAFNENKASNSFEELTNEERENTDQAADMVSADEDEGEDSKESADDEEIRPYVIKEKELENSSSDSGDGSVNENLVQDVEIEDGTIEERITQSSSNADIEMIDRDSDTVEPVEEEEDIDKLVDEELSIPDVNSDNADMIEDEFILV
ncbi:8458_t:CDS:1 [Paraglomus brasilianum]|uniref:8458_t:CDS:1 n=1 Tax=Paraglomus brasilianum TaxID=144538 RepID=A0A9N9FKR3_9GLOM|nr:8458_t:CDS:1 [Paraglomus brasilianum]